MDMEAKVVVSHKSLYNRSSVPFQLFVDNRKVGEVAGYEREYAVDPGSHFAQVEFVFVKTNQVNFSLHSGEEVHLTCSPNFWVALLPVSIFLAMMTLAVIPYNPTMMLFAGGALMLFAPISAIFIVLKPGMLFKLRAH